MISKKIMRIHLTLSIFLGILGTADSQGTVDSSISFTWAWLAGTTTSPQNNVAAVYDSSVSLLNTTSPLNNPGAIRAASCAFRAHANQLFIYGGDLPTAGADLDRVWRFDVSALQWAFLQGSSTALAQPRVFTGPTLKPGGRMGHYGAYHQLRDSFIVYGGTLSGLYLGDLWLMDLSGSYRWTYISGPISTNTAGVYTGANPVPGCRSVVSADIDQQTGVLYMFGGAGHTIYNAGQLNDLWNYDFRTSKWSHMSGASFAGEYGIYPTQKGIYSKTVRPGARSSGSGCFDSRNRRFFVFGGYAYSGSASVNIMNDLWAYDVGGGNGWSWMAGSSMTYASANFGTKRSFAESNDPGARSAVMMTYDTSADLLLLGAGSIFEATYDDIWVFNSTVRHWSWVKGSSTPVSAVFGTKGVLDAANSPNPMNSFCWDAAQGKVFLFGGGESISSLWDQLWMLEVSSPLSMTGGDPVSSSTDTTHAEPVSTTLATEGESTLIESFPDTPHSTPTTTLLQQSWSLVASSEEPSQSSSQEPILYISRRVNRHSSAIASQMTKNEDDQPDSQQFSLPIRLEYLVVFIVIGFVLIAALGCFVWLFKHPTKAPAQIDKDVEVTMTSQPTDYNNKRPTLTYMNTAYSSVNAQTTSMVTSTWVPTTMGVYIPAQLILNYGVSFQIGQKIAQGGGGTVYAGEILDETQWFHNEKIVVKIPHPETMDAAGIQAFYQEISIMNAFKISDRIVKFFGFTDKPYSMVLKCYEYGALNTWLRQRQSLRLYPASVFMLDILNGLSELHSNGVAHCDIKPQNVLIGFNSSQGRPRCVIADFGIARIVTPKLLTVSAFEVRTIRGASMPYASPETLMECRGNLYKILNPQEILSRDIYAFSMIIYEVLDYFRPWNR